MATALEQYLADQKDEEEERAKHPEREQRGITALQKMLGLSPESAMSRIARNFVPDMVEGVEDMHTAASHPVQTAQAVGEMAGAGFEKAGRKFEEFATGEEIPPTPGKEDAINAVGQQLKENFGTPEAALETMIQNPFDVASTVYTGGVAAGVKPVTAAVKQTGKAVGAVRDEMARHSYGIPKATLDKGKDVAREGSRNLIRNTRGGLKRLDKLTKQVGEQINNHLNLLPDVAYIKTTEVLDHLDKLKLKYVDDIDELEAVAHITKKQQELLQRYPDGMTPKQVQKQKTTAYKKGYSETSERTVSGGTTASPSEKTYRAVGRGGKDALESRLPKLKGINDKWAMNAQLKPYLERRVNNTLNSDGLYAVVRDFVKEGSGLHIPLSAAEKLLKYTPDQVQRLLAKGATDDAIAALIVAGKIEDLIEEN